VALTSALGGCIIDRSGHRGHLPFEALTSGDPQAKIIAYLDKIRRTFAA